MPFRLTTLLLLLVVLGSSLALFGTAGIFVFSFFALLAVGIARWWALVWGLLCLLVLIALLLQDCRFAPQAARRVTCTITLKQIALALLNYQQANGCYPPAYIADKNGKPMHSWRVLILPYLGCDLLYRQYDFAEPWNGPNNRKLLVARPAAYVCPNDRDYAQNTTRTSYAAIVGLNAAWLGKKSRHLDDFLGAKNTTIMLAEAADARIDWTEPRDVSLDSLEVANGSPATATVSSMHGYQKEFFYSHRDFSGANVAFVDGSVGFLPPRSLAPNVLPKYLRIGGCTQDALDGTYYYSPPLWDKEQHFNSANCVALAIWLASVALLLYRAIQSRRQLVAKHVIKRAGQETTDANAQTPSNIDK